ncbi:hypothetical protein HanXRQr2_Chr01g0025331 [Helianthus annuus]|uniref:Uncharacterized protein n=1 Tax=Helianthus annuus TaxID=4232 RepID=A0A9K3JX57_HELAN|nr:hypothetical protein HanXRQr2_Chr01g0025331 [Helianthus annuus]KAJ0957199.1 hypothetical protein HanPSC8_Chr01g0024431 [Helianthus annuus]
MCTREHELIFSFKQIQTSSNNPQSFDRWNKQRTQTSTPKVLRQCALKTKLRIRLHSTKIKQSDHPTNRQIRNISHNLSCPKQAQHQQDNHQRGKIKIQSPDHRKYPNRHPNEPNPKHPIRWPVYIMEFRYGLKRFQENPTAKLGSLGHPTRVQPVTDSEEYEHDTDSIGARALDAD